MNGPGKPLTTFNEYLRNRFGCRVQRLPINAGMTCPNRDGFIGTGGCIYCDNRSFNMNPAPSENSNPAPSEAIIRQVETAVRFARRRYNARKFLAYFQTYTNTYAPVAQLRRLYSVALEHPGIVGLMIGTRPDCLPPDVLDLLQDFSHRIMVWVEVGVQSSHDATLERINRGHSWSASRDAVLALKERGILTAAHIILGLPGETPEMMMETAHRLNDVAVDGLKLHHLHAVKGTILAKMYDAGEWTPLEADAYIELAARFLAEFPPETVVMRLMGDCPGHLLTAPHWTMSKQMISQKIRDRLAELR